MKKKSVIATLMGAISEDDIGLFIGDSICSEAVQRDRTSNVYIRSAYDYGISIGVGMAMNTDRRVFIFCEDSYFLRNVSESVHAAVSKCRNLYIIIVVSGMYNNFEYCYTIYNNIMSPRNLLYDMGFMVHNYNKQLSHTKDSSDEIRATWGKIKGPLAITIDVENSMDEIDSRLYTFYEERVKVFTSEMCV